MPSNVEQLRKEMDDIREIIIALNDEYTNAKIEGQLDVEDFWLKLGKTIQELTTNRQYRKIIGSINADILDRNIIKITNKIKGYRKAKAVEDETKANIAYNEAELYIGEVFRILDEIYSSL
jgi:two-component SAPR family response regulator